jgi:hypothetical protein
VLIVASGDWSLHSDQPYFDLLCNIRAKLAKLPITIQWKWIKGHQDDDLKFADLDPMVKDNVLADNLAKSYLNKLISENYDPPTQRFGDEGWSVQVNNIKLASVILEDTYMTLNEPTVKSCWMKKTQLSWQLIQGIDWEICGEADCQLQFHQRCRVSKQVTGHLAIGKKMKQWGFQEHDECPCCQVPSERAPHVLLCRDSWADLAWKTTIINKLESWMISSHMMPQLHTVIMEGLHHWRDLTQLRHILAVQDIRDTVNLQDRIGWYQFVNGHLGNRRKGIQQEYLEFSERRNTGKKWVRELIKKLWGVA